MQEKPDQRNYVQQVLRRTGWSQTELAKRAGLDPSTLSRFLGNPHGSQSLRASSLHRIAQVTGLGYPDLSAGCDTAPEGFAEAEATPIQNDDGAAANRILAVLSEGTINVDGWVLKSRALELAGYKPGDILFVQLDLTPLKGDIVCAQVYDWPNRRAETIFRLFEPPFLVSATTDPTLFKPHSLDNADISVKGVVVHNLRSRTPTTSRF